LKANARLAKGVQDETGVEETFIETDLVHLRREHGHIVADCQVAEKGYVALLVPMHDGTEQWIVDRLKRY